MSFILELNDKIKHLNRNMASIKNKKDNEIECIKNEMKGKDNEISSLKIDEMNLNDIIVNLQRIFMYNIYQERQNSIKNFSFIKPNLIISTPIKNEQISIKGVEFCMIILKCYQNII